MPHAVAMLPELEGAEPVGGWADLRPAGRGSNYVIGLSAACPQLINVAAIRSTGLSASLGIGEHVAALVERAGIAPRAPQRSAPGPIEVADRSWWQRAAERSREAP